ALARGLLLEPRLLGGREEQVDLDLAGLDVHARLAFFASRAPRSFGLRGIQPAHGQPGTVQVAPGFATCPPRWSEPRCGQQRGAPVFAIALIAPAPGPRAAAG